MFNQNECYQLCIEEDCYNNDYHIDSDYCNDCGYCWFNNNEKSWLYKWRDEQAWLYIKLIKLLNKVKSYLDLAKNYNDLNELVLNLIEKDELWYEVPRYFQEKRNQLNQDSLRRYSKILDIENDLIDLHLKDFSDSIDAREDFVGLIPEFLYHLKEVIDNLLKYQVAKE